MILCITFFGGCKFTQLTRVYVRRFGNHMMFFKLFPYLYRTGDFNRHVKIKTQTWRLKSPVQLRYE